MNQKTIIIVLVILVLLGVVFLVADKEEEVLPLDNTSTQNDESLLGDDADVANDGDDAVVPPAGDEVMDGGEAMSGPGSYENYSADKLARAEDGNVVLFFHASWCPTCKSLEADIKGNAGNIPQGLSILKVDYDNSSELKKKYGVTFQHTLVQVDKDGNQIKKWSGSPNLETLVSEVQG